MWTHVLAVGGSLALRGFGVSASSHSSGNPMSIRMFRSSGVVITSGYVVTI